MAPVTALAAASFPCAAASSHHPASSLVVGWAVVIGALLLIARKIVRWLKGKKLCLLTGMPGSS